MISIPAGTRVLLATRPVDFRKGAHGLAALAQEVLAEDPFSGAVIVYRSKRSDRVKILVWDSSGLGRWCTWPVQGELIPSPKLLCADRLATDGIRASGRQHPVQHSHADGSLGLLASEAAGLQPRSDQRLVTTHGRFY
jgi:hypothetical protein